MPTNFFAKNLLYLRKNKGLIQSEIQDSTGFKRNTWSNWENEISEPNIDNVIKIAQFFDVDINDLLTVDLENVHLNEKEDDAKKQGRSTPKYTPNSTPKEKIYAKDDVPPAQAAEPIIAREDVFNAILNELKEIRRDLNKTGHSSQ